MKPKDNDGLWKNIQVVKRDSEIPGKANYCLVSFIRLMYFTSKSIPLFI